MQIYTRCSTTGIGNFPWDLRLSRFEIVFIGMLYIYIYIRVCMCVCRQRTRVYVESRGSGPSVMACGRDK